MEIKQLTTANLEFFTSPFIIKKTFGVIKNHIYAYLTLFFDRWLKCLIFQVLFFLINMHTLKLNFIRVLREKKTIE